ncbi:hypothetical protein ARMSODRAFT_540558 [Armillaria solidipes]|uniref:RING-type domain-containing protein n=1 Tax=Armillaria solidipes TaxID=1076256 RepID=A0A2H3B0U0_9AGAR|nr:hypothetical protein ARMSODRAFT_540558 [Armillaria solidipes]
MGNFVRDEDFDDSYGGLLSLSPILGDVPRAMPADVISGMKIGLYKDWSTSDSVHRCPICLGDYSPTDPVMKLDDCSHWLHKECLEILFLLLAAYSTHCFCSIISRLCFGLMMSIAVAERGENMSTQGGERTLSLAGSRFLRHSHQPIERSSGPHRRDGGDDGPANPGSRLDGNNSSGAGIGLGSEDGISRSRTFLSMHCNLYYYLHAC